LYYHINYFHTMITTPPISTLFPYTTLFRSHWNEALTEAEDLADYNQQLNITGSDISHKLIETASQNAIEAGLSDLITWKQMQVRSEEHTSELQSRFDLVCRLLLEKKKK